MSSKRPSLPKALYAQSPAWATVFFLYAAALWMVPTFLIYKTFLAWQHSQLPSLGAAFAVALASLVGGYGVLLAGFVGHDGVHFSLHRNKTISVLLAILATAPLMVIVEMGFALSRGVFPTYRFTLGRYDYS